MRVSRYLCGETSHNRTSVQLSGPASGSMSRTLNRISQRRNGLCYRRSLPGSTEDTYRSEQLVLPVCCPAADMQQPRSQSAGMSSFYSVLEINLRKTTWSGLSNSAIRPASTLATMMSPASVLTLPKIRSLCIFKAWCWLSSVGLK